MNTGAAGLSPWEQADQEGRAFPIGTAKERSSSSSGSHTLRPSMSPQPDNINNLEIAIDGYMPATGVGNIQVPVDLGPIAAGETRVIYVRAGLTSAADNTWQGVTFSDPNVGMLLQQQ